MNRREFSSGDARRLHLRSSIEQALPHLWSGPARNARQPRSREFEKLQFGCFGSLQYEDVHREASFPKTMTINFPVSWLPPVFNRNQTSA